MKTAEEIAIRNGLCVCHEAYKARGINDPNCPWHSFSVEESMQEYADQFKPEWISVEDELPSPDKGVTIFSGSHVRYGWRRNPEIYTRGAKWNSSLGVITKVTHWMPMPAPPNTAAE